PRVYRTAARELPRRPQAARYRRALDAGSRRDAGDDADSGESSVAPGAASVVDVAAEAVRVCRNLLARQNIKPPTPCRAIRFTSKAVERRPVARRWLPSSLSSPGYQDCAPAGRC